MKKKGDSKKIVAHSPFQSSEICLWIDKYDDIFSDFDSRPYPYRAMSSDFLEEANRASVDKKEGGVELNFVVSKSQRDSKEEGMIKKRLHEHFTKHYKILKKEKNKMKIQGGSFILTGIIFMVIAAMLIFYHKITVLPIQFLVVLLEPGGWFLFWEGLNLMVFKSNANKKDLDFYKKMRNSKIGFKSY